MLQRQKIAENAFYYTPTSTIGGRGSLSKRPSLGNLVSGGGGAGGNKVDFGKDQVLRTNMLRQSGSQILGGVGVGAGGASRRTSTRTIE